MKIKTSERNQICVNENTLKIVREANISIFKIKHTHTEAIDKKLSAQTD